MMMHDSSALRSGRSRLQAALVAAGLDRHAVNAAGEEDRWQMTIGGRRGTATVADSWFVIDFPNRPGRPRRPTGFMAQNDQLPGNAKYVLDGGSVRLRAEVPIDEPAVQDSGELDALVARSVAGISTALGADTSDAACESVLDAEADAVIDEELACLSKLCTEAGWNFSERSEGRVSVDLDVADGALYQASVEHHSRGIQVSANPNRGDPPGEEISRLAVAALMLSVSGTVRLVSAVSRRSNGKPVTGHDAFFRVELPATTSGTTLAHSLSALSVACDLCGREVRALAEDPELARAFLEVCHPRSLPGTRQARRVKAVTSRERKQASRIRTDRHVPPITKEESSWSHSKSPQPVT
jgi:hypothetical protein